MHGLPGPHCLLFVLSCFCSCWCAHLTFLLRKFYYFIKLKFYYFILLNFIYFLEKVLGMSLSSMKPSLINIPCFQVDLIAPSFLLRHFNTFLMEYTILCAFIRGNSQLLERMAYSGESSAFLTTCITLWYKQKPNLYCLKGAEISELFITAVCAPCLIHEVFDECFLNK